MLCDEKEPLEGYPLSYIRVRWVFFSRLFQHVLERASLKVISIGGEMSRLEQEIREKFRNTSEEREVQKLMEKLKSTIESSREMSSLENELAIVSDDVARVERAMYLLSPRTGERVKDDQICGDAERISTSESTAAYGRHREEIGNGEQLECHEKYYCALCDLRSGMLDLTKKPPLKKGVTEEVLELISILKAAFSWSKSDILGCIDRTKSFLSSLVSILSIQTNLNLDVSLSKTAKDQKELLAKLEVILQDSERNRRVAEKATRAVQILSLLFASFVLGEISSNFILWGLQQIWPTEVPAYAYPLGFLLALAISGVVFLLFYFGYLERKRE